MLPPDIGRSKPHIFLLCEFYVELIIIMIKVRLPDLFEVLLHNIIYLDRGILVQRETDSH